jgi:hypothetical protein
MTNNTGNNSANLNLLVALQNAFTHFLSGDSRGFATAVQPYLSPEEKDMSEQEILISFLLRAPIKDADTLEAVFPIAYCGHGAVGHALIGARKLALSQISASVQSQLLALGMENLKLGQVNIEINKQNLDINTQNLAINEKNNAILSQAASTLEELKACTEANSAILQEIQEGQQKQLQVTMFLGLKKAAEAYLSQPIGTEYGSFGNFLRGRQLVRTIGDSLTPSQKQKYMELCLKGTPPEEALVDCKNLESLQAQKQLHQSNITKSQTLLKKTESSINEIYENQGDNIYQLLGNVPALGNPSGNPSNTPILSNPETLGDTDDESGSDREFWKEIKDDDGETLQSL